MCFRGWLKSAVVLMLQGVPLLIPIAPLQDPFRSAFECFQLLQVQLCTLHWIGIRVYREVTQHRPADSTHLNRHG